MQISSSHKIYFSNSSLYQLTYYSVGKIDAPPVFLVHGFCMSAHANWEKTGWLVKLAKTHRVIMLDIRGHGKSDKPHQSSLYPAAVMANDLVAIADSEKIKKFSLLGYSMGARMSAFVAASHPQRVDKLVIAGQAESLITGIAGTGAIAIALRAKSLKAIKHSKLRQFRMLAEMGNNDLEALACCIDAPSPPITAEHLQKITAKTLIIVGKEDEMSGSPEAVMPYFYNARSAVIPNCNHFTALTNSLFIKTSIDFIKNA